MADPEDKKSVVLATRYTAADYEEIARKAARAGVRPSTFQRQATLDKRVTHSRKSEDANLVALVRELNAIGINLNQLMPLAHTTRQRPSQLPDTLKAVNELTLRIIEHMNSGKSSGNPSRNPSGGSK